MAEAFVVIITQLFAAAFSSFFLFFWILWFAMAGLMLFLIVFWITMIIDVSKREFTKSDEKTMWILVVVLGSWVGSIVYYFTVKKAQDGK